MGENFGGNYEKPEKPENPKKIIEGSDYTFDENTLKNIFNGERKVTFVGNYGVFEDKGSIIVFGPNIENVGINNVGMELRTSLLKYLKLNKGTIKNTKTKYATVTEPLVDGNLNIAYISVKK